MAWQRIGLASWHPHVALRSWGLAPLHRDADKLCVACAADEALWLGVWSEREGVVASVHLLDVATGAQAHIELPETSNISTLGAAQPLTRGGAPECAYRLRLQQGGQTLSIELLLIEPAAWAALSGRPAPAPLSGPPSLPPRLG